MFSVHVKVSIDSEIVNKLFNRICYFIANAFVRRYYVKKNVLKRLRSADSQRQPVGNEVINLDIILSLSPTRHLTISARRDFHININYIPFKSSKIQ